MKILRNIKQFKQCRAQFKNNSVGFIPTMGALHAGHQSLIEKSIKENQATVVSLFVNPNQFNDLNDFENYPDTWDKDIERLERLGVDLLFSPRTEEIYSDCFRFILSENSYSKLLCGKNRPGHFDGVLTIVLKLFNIVKPHKAYFGEKDYQQLKLISSMVEAVHLDIEIVPCPTIREKDGLALSSRNQLLSKGHRSLAPELYKIIKSSKTATDAKEQLSRQGFTIDYVEDINGRRFAAAILDQVRLIDNVRI